MGMMATTTVMVSMATDITTTMTMTSKALSSNLSAPSIPLS
jgi:hypothetical protein